MDHQLPDQRGSSPARIIPIAGSIGLGLGMGLAATGALVAGGAIGGLSVLAIGARLLVFRPAPAVAADAEEAAAELVDQETGLPNAIQLYELLRREIARSLRYGDRTALAVFDVRISGFRPSLDTKAPPSPATYVAKTMLEAARTSDIVARIDTTHFAVVLTECTEDGAVRFSERLRTRLGTMPFGQTEDGKGVYVRAWSGIAHWNASLDSPEDFAALALQNLESTQRGYEAAQSYFRGQKAAS